MTSPEQRAAGQRAAGQRAPEQRAGGPRAVGAAVVVVSVLAGVAAAVLISNPVLGIPAAFMLAFASVGALAGLLLLQRKSWADRTWPPGARDQAWSAERARRQNVVYGVFLLVMAAAAGAGLAFGRNAPTDLTRVWLLAGALAVGGIVCIVLGLRHAPPAVSSSKRPEHTPSKTDDGWVQLGSRASFPGWQLAGAGSAGFSRLQLPMAFAVFLPLASRFGSWAVLIGIALAVGGLAVLYAFIRRSGRPALVSHDGSVIRWRGKDVLATEVVSASLILVPWTPDATERSLALVLGGSGGLRSTVGLRRRGRLVLTDVETAALARLVSASSIELPRDRDDPKGRFSRVLYPSHLTKAEAIELVERPPGDGEPLPIVQAPPTR